jgi:uroporphyrinogen III methyltransferase/synthase
MQAEPPAIPTLMPPTILVAPSANLELGSKLEKRGARVMTWPKLILSPPETYEPLHEAIESLFGYDWLVFRNVNAAEFFLRRFGALGHEIAELDSIRVCAMGADTVHKLEASQVHLDVIPHKLSSPAALSAIADYMGGREQLSGLNFLIPSSAVSVTDLKNLLENAGVRADQIASYRTCLLDDSSLTRISALLKGGGIDCVAFTTSSAVDEFATLFDSNDLGQLLTGVVVACIDENTSQAAERFGLNPNVTGKEPSPAALAQAIVLHFAR